MEGTGERSETRGGRNNLVSNVVGAIAIRDIAALFGEFMPVREKWLHLVRNVEKRIALPTTLGRPWEVPGGASP